MASRLRSKVGSAISCSVAISMARDSTTLDSPE
ncbi:Uncharacterised protein [Vibrio cholerae]|nr:Uncharacterised protein [Vibrio cholerae]